MSGSLAPQSRAPRRRYDDPLAQDLYERLLDAGHDRPHRSQIEGMTAIIRGIIAKAGNRRELHTTWRQLARAAGLPVGDMTVDEAHAAFSQTLANRCRYLTEIGSLDGWEPVTDHAGEFLGIMLRIPAGVAQSVRRAAYGARRGGGVGVSRRVAARRAGQDTPATARRAGPDPHATLRHPPEGDIGGGGNFSRCLSLKTANAVRGCAQEETRARAALSIRVRAALGERLNGGVEVSGAELLDACPWLSSVPVDILAREAFRAVGGRDLRISARQRDRLIAAAGLVERYGYEGTVQHGHWAAACAVLDIASGDFVGYQINHRDRLVGRTVPATLGGIAVCVRRYARQRRRMVRELRPAGGGVGSPVLTAPHGVDDVPWREVVDVAGGCGEIGVAELAADEVPGHGDGTTPPRRTDDFEHVDLHDSGWEPVARQRFQPVESRILRENKAPGAPRPGWRRPGGDGPEIPGPSHDYTEVRRCSH